jgi:hypothetical protein
MAVEVAMTLSFYGMVVVVVVIVVVVVVVVVSSSLLDPGIPLSVALR